MAKKIKGKKNNKIDFSIHLNEDALKEMEVSPKEIKETSKTYEDANKYLKTFYHNPNLLCKKCKLLPDLILLKGEQGQLAYVKHDLDCQTDKWKLILEFPLDFDIEKQQRGWISCASKFFKPLFIEESESVLSEEDFSDITQKPFTEFKGIKFDSGIKTPFVMRSKTYAHSAPYASKTTRKQDLESYYKYVWEQYQRLKKKSVSRQDLKYYARYDEVAKKVAGKRFGNLKITEPPKPLTIRNILTSYSKKISS